MAKELVEVVYGKTSKYEIYKTDTSMIGTDFIIHKNGSYWKGTYSSLSAAVDAAKSAG